MYGFTEGCNNKVKDLKRNAYGYRNFNRFLHCIICVFIFRTSTVEKEHGNAISGLWGLRSLSRRRILMRLCRSEFEWKSG
ncbi:MAG: transposase [[Eubacterium] siraeum]